MNFVNCFFLYIFVLGEGKQILRPGFNVCPPLQRH